MIIELLFQKQGLSYYLTSLLDGVVKSRTQLSNWIELNLNLLHKVTQ